MSPSDKASNSPPAFRWKRHVWLCRTVQHTLFVADTETPFFVCHAKYRAHFTCAQPVGLFGAGMDTKSGIAAVLATFDTVTPAKARAERLWQEWTESGELEWRLRAGRAAAEAFYARHRRRHDGSAEQVP